jgi:transketolase
VGHSPPENILAQKNNMNEWNVINNIRIICAEMVEEAQSGHPGAPLGLAPFLNVLFTRHLRSDPDDPKWMDRDFFILSNGHACAIQYVLLHLMGYDISLNDLKHFRQINSKVPGHPEKNITPGVEVTTGPLGQGIANAVGVAIAQQKMRVYNEEDDLFKGRVFCIFGDGCYQEGISWEAFSLAGHLKLDNLTFVYDFNNVTIDGPTSLSMSDDPIKRFEAMNLSVIVIEDGNEDLEAMDETLAKKSDRPKVIILKTSIGRGSRLENNAKVHGAPLGQDDINSLKAKFKMEEQKFTIRSETRLFYEKVREKNRRRRQEWNLLKNRHQNIFDEIFPPMSHELKNTYVPGSGSISTRKHFSNAINEFSSFLPNLLGGSGDLTPSNLTRWKDAKDFTSVNRKGNYIRFGIREHGMCGIMNGIAAYGVHIPFGGTFLNFITYGFPSVRLAAMSKLRVIYVLTHDSIGLGEDGSTHQPIEVFALLRATPNLVVIRPCDGIECRFALKYGVERVDGPTAISLSRHNVKEIPNTSFELSSYGAYYIREERDPDVIILATGSEVSMVSQAVEILRGRNIKASLVSFLSFEIFERQSQEYKNKILKKNVLKVSVEASSTFGWSKYSDLQIGIDTFGLSGKFEEIYEWFGLTPTKISEKISGFIDEWKRGNMHKE